MNGSRFDADQLDTVQTIFEEASGGFETGPKFGCIHHEFSIAGLKSKIEQLKKLQAMANAAPSPDAKPTSYSFYGIFDADIVLAEMKLEALEKSEGMK